MESLGYAWVPEAARRETPHTFHLCERNQLECRLEGSTKGKHARGDDDEYNTNECAKRAWAV